MSNKYLGEKIFYLDILNVGSRLRPGKATLPAVRPDVPFLNRGAQPVIACCIKKAVAAHGRQASPPTNQRREVAFKRPKTSINLHEPILRHHERTPKTLPMLQVHQTPTNRSAPMSAPLPQPPRTTPRAVPLYSYIWPLNLICGIASISYIGKMCHAPY